MPALTSLRKLARFVSLYGPGRTLFKVAARLRLRLPSWLDLGVKRDVGLVGCGQFAFATVAYFLQRGSAHRILACYDIDQGASWSLARALGVPVVAADAQALLATPGLKRVYIASNHASHTDYAVRALRCGLDVHVEKPVAVTREQLAALERARRSSGGRLVAGYNRPFAAALRDLRRHMQIDSAGGMSMQCFVAGHRLGSEHWYRRPEEGTRICGNVGHWLDLWIHLLAWRGLPQRFELSVGWADTAERDDNLAITLVSEKADIASIMLTSRNEPFEGINESIQIQHASTTCKIDDFRRMTVWQGERRWQRNYWPKDAGHGGAILQLFDAGPGRDWAEVEISTLLTLHIADMVRAGTRTSEFSIPAARADLTHAAATP